MDIKDIIIFDQGHIRRNKKRAAKNFQDHNFLFQWSQRELSDRLMDINRTFPTALQIGSRSTLKDHPKIGFLTTIDNTENPVLPNSPYICASEEFLPFAPQSFNLIFSNLNLHTVNDLPGTLLQIRCALKPDGLFIAAMLGGETLHELRHALAQAELNSEGGASPRVAPFADKPQMGDLLQRAGFALPVVDSDILTVTYNSLFKLLHDLRGMGEGNAILARQKKFATRSFFMEAARLYQEQFVEPDGRIKASFEIIFLLGWAPHSSQQKPLQPGSAKTSLIDVLGTS